ncbi:DUF6456 domain-containing protein [Celeribacter sp.]|uniref:DUF6456 domain-containing protein n=1 Tax=Celeribacter sp. TaxID=1890673 RepID=UPI003A8F57DE
MVTLPTWVPKDAQRYLAHTEGGHSIRELARNGGCAPSTVMRQVRRIEQKRDDPLVDEALDRLRTRRDITGASTPSDATDLFYSAATKEDAHPMSKPPKDSKMHAASAPDNMTFEREGKRILRRLSEPGACLAVAKDMEKAVVVRDLPDGRTTRTAVLDRSVAQMLALKGWIEAQVKGKITRYSITSAGRTAFREFLAAEESARAGFAEAPSVFGDSTEAWQGEAVGGADKSKSKRIRYNAVESPVMVLARRRNKDGSMFLPPELVAVAERLREDFELAHMGDRAAQDWEAFLAGEERGLLEGDVQGFGADAAQARAAAALDELGPGLGDVVLRCCCRLEGMEQAEKHMGWSARSGKIVLRIALQRLKRHYDRAGYSNLIG